MGLHDPKVSLRVCREKGCVSDLHSVTFKPICATKSLTRSAWRGEKQVFIAQYYSLVTKRVLLFAFRLQAAAAALTGAGSSENPFVNGLCV